MALMDEQHRQYGKFVNAFLKICQKGDSVAQESLFKAFGFLHAYARDHLRSEEALMETYGYPGQAAHVERHRYFADAIENARSGLLAGPATLDQLAKVNYILVEWFQMHIRSEDKQLARFLDEVASQRADQKLLTLIRGVFGTGTGTASRTSRR
jgi:hemerythrin-like metal-binding protein